MVATNGTKALIVFSLLALSVARTRAEDQPQGDMQDAVQELLSKALQINISARVTPQDQEPVWNVESSKLTLPGRAVNVRIEGENLRIDLVCTPYLQDNGDVLLVAQGQVWLMQSPDKEVKYYPSYYSIPVSFGEKVLYFPLGVPDETKKPDADTQAQTEQTPYLNIELDIQVVPYKEKK